MNILITAGPSYEPIDDVRRLTNFSTGELGVLLANTLAAAGHEVHCLRGVSATTPLPLVNCRHVPFTTNDDLLRQLAAIAQALPVAAVFHAAALCDFKVRSVRAADGTALSDAKVDSRAGELTLQLEPAAKVIQQLRDLFPAARIVGWKYELDGNRDSTLAKAWRQLSENRTDACVVNGRAWGGGFGFCSPPDRVRELPGKRELADFLAGWLKSNP